MYCIYCGKEINENASFCPYCGSKTGTEAKQPSSVAINASAKQLKPVFSKDKYDVNDNIFGLLTALTALISLFLPWVRYNGYEHAKNYNFFSFLKLLKTDEFYFIASDTAFIMGAVVVIGVIVIVICHYTNYHAKALIGDALLLTGVRFEWSYLRMVKNDEYFGSIRPRAGFYVMLVAILIDVIVTVMMLHQRKRIENK